MLKKLNQAANAAIQSKDVADKLMVQGIIPRTMGLAEVESFVHSKSAKFAKIAIAANIKVTN